MDEIKYTGALSEFDHSDLVAKSKAKLSDYRFQHCLRTEKRAIELAKKYDADIQRSSLAALLHDYCKEESDDVFLKYIEKYDLDPDLVNYGNGIWHGIVGAEIIQNELNVHDEIVLNAIRRHTVGNTVMTDVDKIVFVADYTEDGRDFPEVDEARKAANESLDKGMAFEIKHTLGYLIEENNKVYPKMLDSYNTWVVKGE